MSTLTRGKGIDAHAKKVGKLDIQIKRTAFSKKRNNYLSSNTGHYVCILQSTCLPRVRMIHVYIDIMSYSYTKFQTRDPNKKKILCFILILFGFLQFLVSYFFYIFCKAVNIFINKTNEWKK